MTDGEAGHQLHAALTDVGRVRAHNEDAFLAEPTVGLYAVADGMGGHAAGEVASAMAIETLRERLAGREAPDPRASDPADLRDRLAQTLRDAGRAIHDRGRERPEQRGMGTTATSLLLRPDGGLLIGHVGDSRAYRLRGGELSRMTRDHTVVQERVERGELTPEQARHHPASGVLTRALGVPEAITPDTHAGEWEEGDLYLLCSDGLTGMLSDDELRRTLRSGGAESGRPEALEELARALVDAANERGGRDNVTVVLVRPDGAA